MNGIFVAMMVMTCTFESSGRRAMNTTASATWFTSMRGSIMISPLGCGTPLVMRSVIGVAALPLGICEQAMAVLGPSRAVDFVGPVMAPLGAGEAAGSGRAAVA